MYLHGSQKALNLSFLPWKCFQISQLTCFLLYILTFDLNSKVASDFVASNVEVGPDVVVLLVGWTT